MQTHAIIGGNGTIGQITTRELQAMGHSVRIIQRNPTTITGQETLVSADVFDLPTLTKAVSGADVVHLILGLPYSGKVWMEQFPVAIQHTIEAARLTNARVVYFDNVYMYGPVNGIMTEQTPYQPTTLKGRARAKTAQILMDAVEKGVVKALIARSADFYGPYKPFDVIDSMAKKLLKGQKAQVMIRANTRHSMTYIPDSGRAIAALASHLDTFNQIWHMPTDPNALTQQQMVTLVARLLSAKPQLMVVPGWMLKAIGLMQPMIREMTKMNYQYEQDYLFDSSKITKQLDIRPTSYEDGIRAHLQHLGHLAR